jgi:hypothetical protein
MMIFFFITMTTVIISACVTIILIFNKFHAFNADIYGLQEVRKSLTREIEEIRIKIADVPLPNFEDISRRIIECKNDIGEAKGELDNLSEVFYTHQNKYNSRLTAEEKKRKKEEKESEEELPVVNFDDAGNQVEQVNERPAINSRLFRKR